jgi:hypothetical protein
MDLIKESRKVAACKKVATTLDDDLLYFHFGSYEEIFLSNVVLSNKFMTVSNRRKRKWDDNIKMSIKEI